MKISEARAITGSLGTPRKMPGKSYGIPAKACILGAKLARISGTVCSNCYAMKGCYVFPNVQEAQSKRLASITHPKWVRAMVTQIRSACRRVPYFRWHDSGDIQSLDHFRRICRVARLTPAVRHWIPTRERGIVSAYLSRGYTIPENLTVRISKIKVGDFTPVKGFLFSSVRQHKDWYTPPDAHICPAPLQDGKCEDCRACWSKGVSHVNYEEH